MQVRSVGSNYPGIRIDSMSETITIPTPPTCAAEPVERDGQWLQYRATFGANVVLCRADYVDLETYTRSPATRPSSSAPGLTSTCRRGC